MFTGLTMRTLSQTVDSKGVEISTNMILAMIESHYTLSQATLKAACSTPIPRPHHALPIHYHLPSLAAHYHRDNKIYRESQLSPSDIPTLLLVSV